MTPTQVFQKAMQALLSEELPGYLELCTEDALFEFPFASPGRPASVQGRAALQQYFAPIASRVQMESIQQLAIHQTLDPDVAVIEMTLGGKIRATHQFFERSYIAVLTVREGKIARYRDYWNPAQSFGLAAKP